MMLGLVLKIVSNAGSLIKALIRAEQKPNYPPSPQAHSSTCPSRPAQRLSLLRPTAPQAQGSHRARYTCAATRSGWRAGRRKAGWVVDISGVVKEKRGVQPKG